MAEQANASASAPSVPIGTKSAESAQQPRRTSLGGIALVFVLVAAASGATWFLFGRPSPQAATGSVNQSVAATVIHLDGFTVNLADPEDNHFLRVTMDLAIERLPVPVEREKPNSGLPMARIRDTILSVLTVCKAEVLLTSEGKQQLKKNLLEALNRENPNLGVREIYFTEFLVQR